VVKDADEVAALRAAAHAVDAVAAEMRGRPFGGRTEADVSRELVDRMLEHGHQRANFAIVGSGPNGASPHHDASGRTIGDGDLVVCDFGGTRDGYCSDITRMFVVGEPTNEVRDLYALLVDAQERAVRAATVGTPCEAVDAVARDVITAGGFGDRFIHRTGHGIGLEAHEDPYLVSGNAAPLEPGHAFSIEPGIYLPGRFGMRLEDIVVAAADGPDRLNAAPRDLAIVA
jgi:Xaa-Pro aminopeptidase